MQCQWESALCHSTRSVLTFPSPYGGSHQQRGGGSIPGQESRGTGSTEGTVSNLGVLSQFLEFTVMGSMMMLSNCLDHCHPEN